MQELRHGCARVAAEGRWVRVREGAVAAYADSLPLAVPGAREAVVSSAAPPAAGEVEGLVARWLTLDAINFGSGWFPTLRKEPGRSGYGTVSSRLMAHFDCFGTWAARELAQIEAPFVARVLGQDPGHPLMVLFAEALRDLGEQVKLRGGRFADVVAAAGGSTVALVSELATWPGFADVSTLDGVRLPFLKRAQIAAADLARAGAAAFSDLRELTMFADNLVPHVLRLDGVLEFAPELVARIEREELLEHGSREEVEIRACAVHAVELLVACRRSATAAEIDELLWNRGASPRYKASPRHRCRCTAY